MMNRTEMNKKARQMIAEIAEEKGLDRCEIKLEGCMGTFGASPAHKRKRINYFSAEELADYNEWVCACQKCHQTIEDSRELTEETFKRLRP